ncbi:YajQ family cyclic di-GMP-binding protein [Candidatus Neomarinimicrobiota bacterium]
MPSFDIVNQVDLQEVDNALNNTRKDVARRFDFRGSHTELILDKKAKSIHIVTGDDMKMRSLVDMIIENASKRGVSGKVFSFGNVEATSHGHVKRDISIREGIDKDQARQIVKIIKELNLKVQPAIQDEQVRVTGKKIDDLQTIIQTLKSASLDIPLQYVNLKS